MAKILGTTVMSGNISKVVELPDNFVINGQVYDKNTFSPNPLDFLPIPVSASNEMVLSQTAFVNSYWFKNRTSNGFMLDNTDPSSCYVATQAILGGTASVHKLTRNTNGSWTDLQYNAWGNGYGTFVDLLSQDSQKVYYTISRNYSDYSFIAYVKKSDMSGASVNIGKGTLKVLKDTDMYIYFGCPNVNALTFNIGKYNKVTNTVTWLLADTLSSGYYSDTCNSSMDANGVFYAMRDGLGLGMSDHYVAFRKYVLDTQKDLVTTSNVNVDMSLLPNGKIFINSASSMAVTNVLYDFVDQNTGKKYISLIIYNKGTQAIQLNANDSGIYTFEVIDADNWKLVSYTLFNPIIYKALLPVVNNETIVFAYENGCHIYSWDTGSTSYKKVSSFDSPISTVGCDTNNNIYVQYTDTSVDMISNVMPITVFADFELDNYNYNGSDISTNVVVYVKNYRGKFLSTSVTLNLYGNCKFTDTGLRTKTITTSNLDILKIPVTITDQGGLRVTSKIL